MSAEKPNVIGAYQRDATLQVSAVGDSKMMHRPCVDCGLVTGCFCDYCFAQDRDPTGEYAEGQHTPLCTDCDRKFDMCHFCRKMMWATPPPRDALQRKSTGSNRITTRNPCCGKERRSCHCSNDVAHMINDTAMSCFITSIAQCDILQPKDACDILQPRRM